MLVTLGFMTPEDLADHFTKHHAEFGFESEMEYLVAADAFLGRSLDLATTGQCHRRNGDLLRYNPSTEEFGVLGSNRVIKTYCKPDPVDHRQPNNLVYFRLECRK